MTDPSLTAEQEALVRTSQVAATLVPRMARRSRSLEVGDLESLAYLSLRRAAKNFDPARGVPFDGYAFRYVHLDLRRAVARTEARERRHAAFDASYELLERARDPADLFADDLDQQRAHLRDFVGSLALAHALQLLSDASVGPLLDSAEARLDQERRRARLHAAIQDLGALGEVLTLRYWDRLEWDDVATRLGCSNATARRRHDEALGLLRARLARRV